MSAHRHNWYTSESFDGGRYQCRKYGRDHKNPRHEAHDCAVSNAVHIAVDPLSQAKLDGTHLENELMGEEQMQNLPGEQLFLASQIFEHATSGNRPRPRLAPDIAHSGKWWLR